jgi:hypothetical protein
VMVDCGLCEVDLYPAVQIRRQPAV